MAHKPEIEQVVAAANLVGHRVVTPKGDIYIAASSKSQLAARFHGLCETGALHEFVHAYLTHGTGQCHTLAYEFTYAVVMSLAPYGPVDRSVVGWKWCMADAPPIDSKHSWIEFEAEAIDVSLFDGFSAAPGEPPRRPVVIIQPARALWKRYQVTNVQSLSFVEFVVWLQSSDNRPLFSRHADVDFQEAKRMYRDGIVARFGGSRW